MNPFCRFRLRLGIVFVAVKEIGNHIHSFFDYITGSKWGKFFLKWRLFTAIPIIGLTITINTLRGNKDKLIDEMAVVNIENNVLRTQVLDCFRTFNDIPAPIWSKLKVGKNGYIMLRVNDNYFISIMSNMGYKRTAYIGKHDDEIYTKEIAEVFKKEDSLVAATGKPLITLNRLNDSTKNLNRDLIVLKWRKIERKDTLILGQAIDVGDLIKELEEQLNNQNHKE